jgi:hypothetical protein
LGSITTVHVYVSGTRSVFVSDVSQPEMGVPSFDPISPSIESTQSIVALVSPEPPSRKLTWMSASGGLWKVAVAPAPGGVVPQPVPFATVTNRSVSVAAAAP